mgnify:FL=1
MQYRPFGKLDWKVSALGFGAMRLPVIDGDTSKIDEAEAIRMIRHAIDQGVNYVDTAWPYHSGMSEGVVGKALKDGYRERVKLATKMPTWKIETYADFDTYFNQQIERLQTDHIDFYLLHALQKPIWEKMKELNALDWFRKAKADGKIKHIGFSFHDDLTLFKEIVDYCDDWEFCQIQYNYIDVKNQAGTEGLKYAAAKGLAVIIMEPLLGGSLVNPPEPVQALWDTAAIKRAPADWALQWIWDQPEVSLLLSGMSKMDQVEQNLASACRSAVNSFTAEEKALVDRVRETYDQLRAIPCTACEYCQPCPQELRIPAMFSLFNDGKMYNTLDVMRQQYKGWLPEGKRAADCVACQECESKCPQHIAISQWMPLVDEVLMQGVSYDEALKRQPGR